MSWRDILAKYGEKEDIECITCGEKYTLSEMEDTECKYCAMENQQLHRELDSQRKMVI